MAAAPAGHRLCLGGPGLVLGTVPSGRRPALIGTRWRRPAGRIDLARCSSRGAGPALGALPAFPGVGTPRGNGFSCGCGKALPPSMWGRTGNRGHAGSGEEGLGAGDPQSASARPRRGSGDWDRGDAAVGAAERLWDIVFPYCPMPAVCHTGLGLTPTYTQGHCGSCAEGSG